MTVQDLPTLNAILNGMATVLLVAGFICIKKGRIKAHASLMAGALVVSAAFLTSYLIYHAYAGSKSSDHMGAVRPLYLLILFTHVPLAAINLPMIVATVIPAIRKNFAVHKRRARWTLPVWLYVSVTGVLVYFMLYVWFPA